MRIHRTGHFRDNHHRTPLWERLVSQARHNAVCAAQDGNWRVWVVPLEGWFYLIGAIQRGLSGELLRAPH